MLVQCTKHAYTQINNSQKICLTTFESYKKNELNHWVMLRPREVIRVQVLVPVAEYRIGLVGSAGLRAFENEYNFAALTCS